MENISRNILLSAQDYEEIAVKTTDPKSWKKAAELYFDQGNFNKWKKCMDQYYNAIVYWSNCDYDE